MIYLNAIFMIGFILFIFWHVIPYSESSSRKYGKRLNKRVNMIKLVIERSKDKDLYFESKGKTFKIKVENMEVAPGIKYETIPVYTCKNVYIDDELVCRVHRLERLFTKAYLAEFSNKRHDYEVAELIYAAYKKAKNLDKDYWRAWLAKQGTENSFYDKKNN